MDLLFALSTPNTAATKLLRDSVPDSTNTVIPTGKINASSGSVGAVRSTNPSGGDAGSRGGSAKTLAGQSHKTNILAMPSAQLAPNKFGTSGKSALEYESKIFELKQRLDDANNEIKRLNENNRKSRQLDQDVYETNILIRSERDYYKALLGDSTQEDKDSQSGAMDVSLGTTAELLDSSVTAELNGLGIRPDDEKQKGVIKLIAGYIKKIEMLQSNERLYQNNGGSTGYLKSVSRNQSENINLDSSTITSTIVGMIPSDPLGKNVFDSNVLILENDLTSSVARVISQSHRDLQEEQRQLLLSIQDNNNNNSSSGGVTALDGPASVTGEEIDELTSLVAANGIFSDGAEGQVLNRDFLANFDSKTAADVEIQDKIFRQRQQDMSSEVIGLSSAIQMKEQLLMQLQHSQKQYEMMKLFYESKLEALSIEVQQNESEKSRLAAELNELSNKAVRTVLEEDDLKNKLREKDNQLQQLRKRQQDLAHHSQVQSRSLQQINKLETDIEQMKRQRVDLMKTIHTEKKKHLVVLNHKAREIEKLKSELIKTSAEIQKISKEKDRAERMAKDALKEGADLKKKVFDISKQNFDATLRISKKAPGARLGYSAVVFRPVGKNLITEEELKTKRWLDKALQNIAAREQAADSLRRQYEQQLALLNQKKMLEGSRRSLRELVTGRSTSPQPIEKAQYEGMNRNSTEELSAEEEAALREIENRIQNIEGQLISRKLRIDNMQNELHNAVDASNDSAIETLQTKNANSLPAAQSIIRLMFEMLVSSKLSIKGLLEDLDKSKIAVNSLKTECDSQRIRVQTLQRAQDLEITKLNSEFEEKLSGLMNFSDVALLIQGDSGGNVSGPLNVPEDMHMYSHSFEGLERTGSSEDGVMVSPSSNSRLLDVDVLPKELSNIPSRHSESLRNSSSHIRGLFVLSNQRNATLKYQLSRVTGRVQELQTDLDDFEVVRKSLEAQVDVKECDNRFLQEECRMLRELCDEYKARVLALEGDQGVSIVRTVNQIDQIKRVEKGMVTHFGDDPSRLMYAFDDGKDANYLNNSLPHDADSDAESDDISAFGHLSEEISKTGIIYGSNTNTNNNNNKSLYEDKFTSSNPNGSALNMNRTNSNPSINAGGSSIFDRLANPSYFTGTQKKLFQRDYIESKRAKVQQIKKDETIRKKKDDGSVSTIGNTSLTLDDESPAPREHSISPHDQNIVAVRDNSGEEVIEHEEVIDDKEISAAASFQNETSNNVDIAEENQDENRGEKIFLCRGSGSKSADIFDAGIHKSPFIAQSQDDSSPSREIDVLRPLVKGSNVPASVLVGTPVADVEGSGGRSNTVLSSSGNRDDVFSRLINPQKFTGIHKATVSSSTRDAIVQSGTASNNLSTSSVLTVASSDDVFLRLQKQPSKSKLAVETKGVSIKKDKKLLIAQQQTKANTFGTVTPGNTSTSISPAHSGQTSFVSEDTAADPSHSIHTSKLNSDSIKSDSSRLQSVEDSSLSVSAALAVEHMDERDFTAQLVNQPISDKLSAELSAVITNDFDNSFTTADKASSFPSKKTGWLKKMRQGALLPLWDSRYFVLQDAVITYYEDKEGNALGSMNLIDATIQGVNDSDETFIIYSHGCNGEELTLKFQSSDERREWNNAIDEHIKFVFL